MAQDIYSETCSVCVGSLGDDNIVEVTGEIDVATVSLLAKALADAVQSGKGHVILDTQRLMYIDSAGIQTLLSTYQMLAARGRKFVLVGCHGIFHRLLQINKLDDRIPMFSTVEEAAENLQTTGGVGGLEMQNEK